MPDNLTLNITGLAIPEIKKVAQLIREFEREEPDRDFLIWVSGTENWDKTQAIQLLKEIFPRKK